MAPAAARRAKAVQRTHSQGLRGNPDACRPGRGSAFYIRANRAGGNARPVSALSVQPTAAMGPGSRAAALVVFPPLLTSKAVPRPGRPAPGGIPAGGWRAEVVAPHGLVDTRASGRPQVAPTTSAQAADHSLPRKRESSFPPLGLLSPPNPLRWASAGAPLGGRILSAPTGLAVGRPSAGLHSPSQGAVTSGRCRTGWSPARRSGNRPACPRRTRRAPPGSPGRRTRP